MGNRDRLRSKGTWHLIIIKSGQADIKKNYPAHTLPMWFKISFNAGLAQYIFVTTKPEKEYPVKNSHKK